MTKTQQLYRLLSALMNDSDFQISSVDLNREHGGIEKIAIKSGWLIESYAKRFKCPECGTTHKVEAIDKRFFIGCDMGEYTEPLELTKKELVTYKFSTSEFSKWVIMQLKLSEAVEKVSDSCWYLGKLELDGKTRKVYFVNLTNVESVPKSTGRIVLVIGQDQHQSFASEVNILDSIKITSKGFSLDKKSLLASFSHHKTIDGDIVKINDKLILNQEQGGTRKSFIRFGTGDDGQFKHVVTIRPMCFNIVYYLNGQRKTEQSRKSSAEIVDTGGISKSKRSVTMRIKEINDILISKDYPQLILRDSDDKYYINPDLYNK